MHRHEITDEEWFRFNPLLPSERSRRGRPAELPNRQFMNAIVFIAKTGIPWRDLPERFGPWQTIYNKFSRWNKKGVFKRILDTLSQDADNESSMADSSYIRVHQHATGGKGGHSLNVLDALAEALQPRSMLSWTVWVTQPTCILPPATSMMSSKRQSSSR